MDAISITRPVRLEQREITDAINTLQEAKKGIKDAKAPASCHAHGAMSEATTANLTASILSLRLQENILYMMQHNTNSTSFIPTISWGKWKATGFAAILIALAVVIIILGVRVRT